MQLPLAGLFVAATCALGVQAMNAGWDNDCQQFAIDNCPNYRAARNAYAFTVFRYQCLRLHWETLLQNFQCPHPDVGCACYNGCVQDRHDSEGDVGGWCTVACKDSVRSGPGCT
ncbi:hypothetical protein V8E36_006903 [Tilletia maclaganii]